MSEGDGDRFDCPSCAEPIIDTDEGWIEVDVHGGPAIGESFNSRDRYHVACWSAMVDDAVTAEAGAV